MSEMVEKVARAQAEAIFGKGCPLVDEDFLRARAAIEAMREPTDLMGNGLPEGYRPGSHSAGDIWKAMIDAALSEVEG